jgi:4-diphosphocytidyl-2-C-methyl-D-erythritol kinase
VGFYDDLTLTVGGEGLHLRCNRPELEGEDNLCLKALRLWQEEAGHHFGAQITLTKRIPFGAGLGGGSSNAAAILLLANQAAGCPLSLPQLKHLGLKIGADVPLFLSGGALLMEGIGERLRPLPSLDGWVLITRAPLGLATPAVYRAYDTIGAAQGAASQALLQRWSEPLAEIARGLGNDLIPACRFLGLDVEKWLGYLRYCKPLGCCLTGSGSAVFALYGTQAEAQAGALCLEEKLKEELAAQELKDVPCIVAPLSSGGIILE